jgi:class 3 adenylate cyclase
MMDSNRLAALPRPITPAAPNPACLVCGTALAGVLGAIGRLGGVRRSSENPNVCNRCNGHIEEGRIIEVAVFFADLSGYTRLTHDLGPERTHELLDAYLRRTRDVLVKWDGFVTQFVGDEVMAFFNAPIQRPEYRSLAVGAALELLGEVADLRGRFDPRVDVTIGIAAGHARVGKVGSEEIAHYSAIGNVVNRAARLVSYVEPGGVLVDAAVYQGVAGERPDAVLEQIEINGFDEPVEVARIRGESASAPADKQGGRRREGMRLATTLSAMLGAPCAGYLTLNSAAVALGLGSFGMGAALAWLDQSLVRVPLLVLASVGAVAILSVVRWRDLLGEGSRSGPGPTRQERRRNRLGAGLALLSLGVVIFELIAHQLLH